MTDEARVLGFYVAMTTAATAFLALLRWDGLSLRALFIGWNPDSDDRQYSVFEGTTITKGVQTEEVV